MERLDFAIGLAREAGDVLRFYAAREKSVEFKGRGNLVTIADRESERLIVGEIRSRYPDDSILAEESGLDGRAAVSAARWIVDPLDGTTNYAHGFPFYCVSIAFERNGAVECGAVYDPVRDETFSAAHGEGARLNGQPIRVSTVKDLGQSLLCTGFPYRFREKTDEALGLFRTFLVASQAVRRAGAAALDLCYVAAGRLDGFWELDLEPWDTAAGVVILEEATGRVTDFRGGSYSVRDKEILASNGRVHDAMIRQIGTLGLPGFSPQPFG